MRCVQRIRNLNGDSEQRLEVHRPFVDQVFERGPVEVLHRDEGLAFMLSDFVDRANVGMIQSRRRARLTPESLQTRLVVGEVVGEKFQGDEAAKIRILGLEDHSHTAAAKFFQNTVARDRRVEHSRRILRGRSSQVNGTAEGGRGGSRGQACLSERPPGDSQGVENVSWTADLNCRQARKKGTANAVFEAESKSTLFCLLPRPVRRRHRAAPAPRHLPLPSWLRRPSWRGIPHAFPSSRRASSRCRAVPEKPCRRRRLYSSACG